MIKKIESNKRYFSDHGWLKTHFLFSFAEYYDPGNMNFGVLRVFNDDRIDAHSGFGDHGHDNMEIVTIVMEGALTHKDSMGNTGVIRAGEVQYMSAGTGVVHAELNEGDQAVHLYQIWMMPRAAGLMPAYNQKNFSTALKPNNLTPLVSGTPLEGALDIQADAVIYSGILIQGASISYVMHAQKGVLIYITTGSIEINGVLLEANDQARIVDENTLSITAMSESQFLLIEVSMNTSDY